MRSASVGELASTRSARAAKRSSAARNAPRRRPSARRCRRRSGRRPATDRARRAAPRPAARRPTGSAVAGPGGARARERARGSSRRLSARTGPNRWSGSTSGESTCSPSTGRGGSTPRRRRRSDPPEVAGGELRPAQAERLDEQHPVGGGEAGHQVVLVGPQLGVPVGEADADDVAAPQPQRARRLGRDEPVAHPLELLDRLLVVVVATDVEPVVLGLPRAHDLAGRDQPQDELGEVETLARLDVREDPGREAVHAHADAS